MTCNFRVLYYGWLSPFVSTEWIGGISGDGNVEKQARAQLVQIAAEAAHNGGVMLGNKFIPISRIREISYIVSA